MSDEAAQQVPEQALVGTVIADRYRVERLLGQGGMGSVYLAEHVLMKKAVALKVLHREMTAHAEVVARFEREAVAAARIDHPNVAAALDFGRLEDGSFYLALEYIHGRSLRDLMRDGPLDLGRSLAIAHQIIVAIVAAHAAGIVHRDLKPENVMLVIQPDGRDLVKVLDFGIAKVAETVEPTESGRQLTRIGAVMGTVGYMAPEQALGQAVDHRADLYAFGIVLYEMIAGCVPFLAEEASQILAKQLTETPAPLPPTTPPALNTLVGKLLQRRPDDRPTDAATVLEEIAQIRAIPPDSGDRLDATPAPSSRTTPEATSQSAEFDDASAASRPKSRSALLVAAAAVAVLGVVVVWKGRTPHTGEPTSTAPSAQTAPPTPSAEAVAPPSASAAPSPSAVPAPATAPSDKVTPPVYKRSDTQSYSKTTSANGRTVTTRTRSTTTSSEQRSEHTSKRRTGPGGIYIPPPSQWFK